MNKQKKLAYRLGVIILIALAVLTAFEYYLAFLPNTIAALFVVALIKAWIILKFFMHVSSLWSEGGH